MAIYSLNEGLFSKKPKLNFTSEQKKECKDIEAQIKKIGPSLVNKYNKDKDLLHKLQNAVRRDLLPYDSGLPDVTNGINYKFGFHIMTSGMQNNNRGQYYNISIDLLDCLRGAFEKYIGELDPDNTFDTINSVVGKIYREVGKELVNQIEASTVKVKYEYEDDVYSGLDIIITPKQSETNESAIAYHEECISMEEYIDSLDEYCINEIDIEYLTEGLGSVMNKIKTVVANKKQKLKDKANKIAKEWERKDELKYSMSMQNGHYFTDLKVTVDDYIDLPTFDKAFDNAQYVLDDLTYIFETAWKKIVNTRNENSSYKDYSAALKDLKKMEDDVDKQYNKFDTKGKMEDAFGLTIKPAPHTLTNKDISKLMNDYKNINRCGDNIDRIISNTEGIINDEWDELSDMADDYQKQLDKSNNDDEKSRLKYLIDSVDTLAGIECSTNDALGEYLDVFDSCAKKYKRFIEKYLSKVDIDMKKQMKKN